MVFLTDIHIFDLPQAPFIVNGRTMLPFRYIGELLGALVFYDDTTHTAMAVYGQHNLGAHLNTIYDNATGHRRNLLRAGNIQFGFGAKYSRKESVYTYFTGPDLNFALSD